MMRLLRSIYAYVLTFCLVLSLVVSAGAMGMAHELDASGTADGAVEHVMAPQGMDCPSMAHSDDSGKTGHDRPCAMTACCFSAGNELRADGPATEFVPARYARFGDHRLTQAEPERAKKPPRFS